VHTTCETKVRCTAQQANNKFTTRTPRTCQLYTKGVLSSGKQLCARHGMLPCRNAGNGAERSPATTVNSYGMR
jgi:hypothetical protein